MPSQATLAHRENGCPARSRANAAAHAGAASARTHLRAAPIDDALSRVCAPQRDKWSGVWIHTPQSPEGRLASATAMLDGAGLVARWTRPESRSRRLLLAPLISFV